MDAPQWRKRIEKKLDGNCTRMLRAILNQSWKPHPTKHQLYTHLPPISKTTQIRPTRHAGHCWKSKDELISDVLSLSSSHGWASIGWPTRTYLQQLRSDTGCCREDLPEATDDRDEWSERVREIRVSGMTWWWWWWSIFTNPSARAGYDTRSIFKPSLTGLNSVFLLLDLLLQQG